MPESSTKPINTAGRIHRLPDWYCQKVMRIRLTTEVDRLWFEFFKQGYNGKQLAAVALPAAAHNRSEMCSWICTISDLRNPPPRGPQSLYQARTLATHPGHRKWSQRDPIDADPALRTGIDYGRATPNQTSYTRLVI